jgi:hypothetical protein
MMYNISHDILLAAARKRYGPTAQVSAPYWVDHEIVRVGITLDNWNFSWGSNFFYKENAFH